MHLPGELFLYDPLHRLSAFESGCIGSTKVVILVGGLTDGFMTIPYTEALSGYLEIKKVALVHCLLRSSYLSYGTGCLDNDAEDLCRLLGYLHEEKGKEQVVFLGHSTGCQDIMRFLGDTRFFAALSEELRTVVAGAVLQAPVSDREHAFHSDHEESARMLAWAKSNRGMYHQSAKPVMSASRLVGLLEKL